MPGRGGRPEHAADQFCSCQGSKSPGLRYIDTVKKDGDVYYYSKFKHADPTIADHVIQGWEPPEHDLIEYDRGKNETTVFGRKPPEHDLIEYDRGKNETTVFGRKGAHLSKVWNVVIYKMNRVKQNQTALATELKNLGIPILKIKDLLWFLKPKRTKRLNIRASLFISNLSKYLEDSGDLIITYGDLDLNEADRIAYLFDCDMTSLTDQFGILKQFEKRVRMRETQKKVYNDPQPTLPVLINPID